MAQGSAYIGYKKQNANKARGPSPERQEEMRAIMYREPPVMKVPEHSFSYLDTSDVDEAILKRPIGTAKDSDYIHSQPQNIIDLEGDREWLRMKKELDDEYQRNLKAVNE